MLMKVVRRGLFLHPTKRDLIHFTETLQIFFPYSSWVLNQPFLSPRHPRGSPRTSGNYFTQVFYRDLAPRRPPPSFCQPLFSNGIALKILYRPSKKIYSRF